MPVLDGYEAARQIKTDPATKDAVLIAVTGALSENAIPRARAAGFSYFVHKEVGARSFVEKIVRLVRDAAAAAEAAAPPEPVPASAAAPPAAPALCAVPSPASEPAKPKKRKPRKRRKATQDGR